MAIFYDDPAHNPCSFYRPAITQGHHHLLLWHGLCWLRGTSGISEAINRLTPMKARVEPYGTDMERVIPLKKKESEIALLTGSTGTILSRGWYEFNVPEWGPQTIRQVFPGNWLQCGLYVRANSPIKTISELKGKRIPYCPGWPAGNEAIRSYLAFGNVTFEDVTKVTLPGYTAQMQAIIDGVTDTAYSCQYVPKVQELAAGPHGLRWLPMPESDVEGWKRLHAVAPWLMPTLVTKGTAVSPDKPVWLAAFPYSLWAYDFADESVIYHVVKAIDKGYEIIKGMHPYLAEWTVANALAKPLPIPYHPGSIKYFKEIGKWTIALDGWQQDQLQAERSRMESWKTKKK